MSRHSRSRVETPEEQTERISVFERLGKRFGSQSSRSNDYTNESDLRSKMNRKRRPNDVSPNRRSTSPKVRQHLTSGKNSSKSEDKLVDNNSKVRSLVMTAHTRPESPTSTSRRSGHSSHNLDEDFDSLELKRLELQKQLQELEKNSDDKKTITQLPEHKETINSSRSSSIISLESSSTLKSLTKTESSENSEKKDIKSSAVREEQKPEKVTESKKSERNRSQVSSSIALRNVTKTDNSNHRSEVKLDRHGNVRISLDEMERQKRLRAERFGSNSESLQKSSMNEPKLATNQREGSYSPPHKRSKDLRSGRHRHISNSSKMDRRDDYKHKFVSRNKYEPSLRSRSRSHSSKRDDRSKAGSERSVRNYLDSKSTFRDESRYSDRDNTSITSRKRGHYSRDDSPTHSSHSKVSVDRDSSIGSDFSRRSKSEQISKSIDNLLASNPHKSELKSIDIKANDSIEEMSPISADSTIPDVDAESTQSEPPLKTDKIKSEDCSQNKEIKTEDESEDNFSEWSEGEDDLLMKTEGFETMDEVCNISDSSLEKDTWIQNKSNKKKVETRSGVIGVIGVTAHNKDDALEAISDDELDAIIGESDPIDPTAESQHSSSNRQVLDALDIDWGSLVSETKTEYIPGSGRKRFSAANVLMRIGFSQAFAGPEMTQKLTDFCQTELKEEFVPFKHPMAAIHSFITDRLQERRQLFGADITQSTVLSGRKDLQIRKMFNKTNFKLLDNCLISATVPSHQKITQSTNSSLVNDSSVSSTNPTETHVSDIECF